MDSFIEQFMEVIENARENFEDAHREGEISGDVTELLSLLVGIYDELEALQADEDE